MSILLALSIAATALLFATTVGYFGVLHVLAWFRPRHRAGTVTLPPIAIVVPTLNEAGFIDDKLRDLLATAYPRDRFTIHVVDGGSTDGTVSIVERAIARGEPVRLIRLERTSGHGEQGLLALRSLREEIVVLTDADGRLDRSCITHLVTSLLDDPALAVVGAAVRPESPLPEERLHWQLLNHVWWLEGEALSSGSVSGVCYAVRRAMVFPLGEMASALDMHLALAASARGYRVGLCRDAQAIELRVPASATELVALRRRRGRHYAAELQRAWHQPGTRLGARIACALHLWQFQVTPRLTAVWGGLLTLLLLTGTWLWSLACAAAVIVPACLVYATAAGFRDGLMSWRTLAASGRLLALTWFSLVTIRPQSSVPEIPDAVPANTLDGVTLRRPSFPHAPPLRRSSDATERVQPAM